jgi:hypothetical protein
MIVSNCPSHGGTINALAAEGKLRTARFTTPDGVEHVANSAWSAHDWLREHGYFGKGPFQDGGVLVAVRYAAPRVEGE